MIHFSKYSLSTKLAALSVSIAVILGLIMSLIQISMDFVQQERSLDAIVNQILHVTSTPAAQTVFNLDKKVAQNLVDGILKYNFIVEADIVDDIGNQLAFGQVSSEENKYSSQLLSWITTQFSTATQPLLWSGSSEYSGQGTLTIKIDHYIALQDYFNRSKFVILAGIVRNLLLSLILLWVFRRLLGLPLKQLADDIQNKDVTQPDQSRITIHKDHQYNELGQVVDGINEYATANAHFLRQLIEAERAAKINEALYRDIAESAADWFWELNADLRFSIATDRFCEICGFTADEIIGKPHQDLIILDGIKQTKKMQAHELQLAAHQPFRDFECLLLTKLGPVLPMRINGKPIFNTEGGFLGYRGTGIDLTKQVKAQRVQEQRDSMLSDAAKMAHLGYAIKRGEKLELESVSSEYAAMFGYSSIEFMRQFPKYAHQLSLIYPDDRKQYIVSHLSQNEYGTGRQLEYRIVGKDQHVCHIIEWSRMVANHNEEEQQLIIVTIQNVTDIKRVEQKLILTEQRFRHLYESSMAAMATLSTAPENTSAILSSNHAFATLFGYQNPNDIIKNFNYKDHWYDTSAFAEFDHLLNKQGELRNYEVRYLRKDGTLFWATVSIKSLPEQQWNECIIIDISKRKQVETELKEQQQHLEILVQQRTDELQRINEEEKSFSYSISHDLRESLRAINGFSKALLEDYYQSFDDVGRDYLDRVCNASLKIGNTIDSLLILSQLSHQKMVIEKVSIDELAKDILADLQDANTDRKVETIIQQGLEIEADRELIRIALMNLLNNAWKFTRNQDTTTIELGMSVEHGKRIFFIRDNGVGFDMAYANNLFGEFQRLHNVKDYEGIGIGLATVKRIFKRHGGMIWVQSRPDAGATFYFTLEKNCM